MVEAEFLLELLMRLLANPARLDCAGKALKRRVGGEIGEVGKKANCQTLVSLTLASGEVPVMAALRLFLPENWTSDPRRLARAKVPEARQAYRSKPKIAIEEFVVRDHH